MTAGSMKAAVNDYYGPPEIVAIRDLPIPKPQSGEVLIRVHATTVSRTDSCALRAHPFFVRPFTGWFRPKRTTLGLDFAGTVDALGENVTKFARGDRVFGLTPEGYGAHAEYVCVPADSTITTIPPGKQYNNVVVCEGAWYANTYLKRFNLKPGHSILVYGASGAIGTAAVQLAKIYGAEVTAVVSTPHLNLAKRLGANRVIDYTAEDFSTIDASFDFVLDAVGKTSFFQCLPLLKPNGVFAATDLGTGWQNVFLAAWSSLTGTGRVVFPTPEKDLPFIEFLKARIQSGEFQAIIDKTYSLQDIVEAYRYVATEQKVGVVVINLD